MNTSTKMSNLSICSEFTQHLPLQDSLFLANASEINENQMEESEIIRQLVFERFRDAFEKFFHKKHYSNLYEKNIDDVFCPKKNSSDHDISLLKNDDDKTNNNTESCNNIIAACTENEKSYEEYDPNKFLETALGEEMMNSTSSSTLAGSTMSEDRSVGTSNLSALISKTLSLYSFTSKTNNSISSKSRFTPILEADVPKQTTTNEDKILTLIMKRVVQEMITDQIYKALNYCSTTKEFYASSEHVEAEKALLVSICRREMITEEISRLEYKNVETDSINTGKLTVSSIKISPKQTTSPDTQKEFKQWFFCILRCEDTLHASQTISALEDGTVQFEETFNFENLLSNFEIHFSLFSLRIRSNIKEYTHESKFRLKTKRKIFPALLFHKKKRQSYNIANNIANNRPSSFTLWGQTKINVSNCNNGKCLELQNFPRASTLSNFVEIEMKSTVYLNETRKGFLSIGYKMQQRIDWNRRWCFMKGSRLSYWNSPYDVYDKEAIKVLDLSKCISQPVTRAERSLCARPRTLVLDIVEEQNGPQSKTEYCFRKYFLAADTLADMKDWEKSLNSVIATLRNWNCMTI